MADINILDPNENPNVTLRLIRRDPVTRAVTSETVQFDALLGQNIFTITSGKTQAKFGKNKEREVKKPLTEWSNEIKLYLSRGFSFVTTEKTQKKSFKVSQDFAAIKNQALSLFIKQIVEANDEKMQSEFTKSIEEIPKECINRANKILIILQDELDNESLTVSTFNDYVKQIFVQLPISVSKQDNYFATVQDPRFFESVIQKLQERLDTICQQLRTFSEEKEIAEKNKPSQTILEANNLEMREVTDEAEKEAIKKMMSDQAHNYVRAWKVTNLVTERRFQEYCNKENLTEECGISHLWHGTGFENIWSIFKSGLYLNPEMIKSKVRICGKVFGYGLYFAPYCRKSMRYTFSTKTTHRGGKSSGGYLLIFKVATGKPYDIYREGGKRPSHWEDFHREHPECHCTWARANLPSINGLQRLNYDEVIVYQECQATIEYVVEFSDIHY